MNKKISIIGIGKIGSVLANSLINNHSLKTNELCISNRSSGKLDSFQKIGIKTTSDNAVAAKEADLVFLAVKPSDAHKVCVEIKNHIKSEAVIVSLVAGVRIRNIKKWLNNKKQKVIRAMPNTPMQINQATTGWTASSEVEKDDKKLIKNLLSKLGDEIYFKDESKLDAVTAISGSGPAYLFYFAENLIASGEELGLTRAEAEKLVCSTLVGSSALLSMSNKTVRQLRKDVTSKGGTTEAAINYLEKEGFGDRLNEGLLKAYERSIQLSK